MSDEKITALIAWNRERAIHHSGQAASCWRAGFMDDNARLHEDISAKHTAAADALEASVQAPTEVEAQALEKAAFSGHFGTTAQSTLIRRAAAIREGRA